MTDNTLFINLVKEYFKINLPVEVFKSAYNTAEALTLCNFTYREISFTIKWHPESMSLTAFNKRFSVTVYNSTIEILHLNRKK